MQIDRYSDVGRSPSHEAETIAGPGIQRNVALVELNVGAAVVEGNLGGASAVTGIIRCNCQTAAAVVVEEPVVLGILKAGIADHVSSCTITRIG